jgi:hypothetical protein
MKPLFIIIITFLLFTSICAQDSTWQYGLQIGANLSSFTGENPYGDEPYSNFGINFGMYYKYLFSRVSSIYLEFRYINKGAQWGCTWIPISGCDSDRSKYDLTYIEIPVYYTATVIRFKDAAELLTLQIGPYFSYAVSTSSSELYEAPGDWVPPTAGRNFEDYINRFDYGISVGSQLFHNKNHNIFFRFVIDVSLLPLFKEDFVPGSGDSKNTIKSFIIFFGIET